MKLICFFTLLITVSCNKQVQKNQKLIHSLTDEGIEIRGNLIQVNKLEFRLDYYDVYEKDSSFEFLKTKGYQGGGPSWAGIIYGAIKMSDEILLEEIRFDDEAEGLAIWSSDKSKLEKIGRLISVIKLDERILMQAIEIAEISGKME
ncbi:Imm51 family immunity protein [Tenacibaculum aiptasiae]|uniref:Imm51 family immunity protein n=1 Tax=Tenacibaculum aiptasiae TaxID=426481 RepID=UPI0023301BC0|nr:Imm51 family immunity protein [Tenacibaculum aiptasiae]